MGWQMEQRFLENEHSSLRPFPIWLLRNIKATGLSMNRFPIFAQHYLPIFSTRTKISGGGGSEAGETEAGGGGGVVVAAVATACPDVVGVSGGGACTDAQGTGGLVQAGSASVADVVDGCG